MADAEDLKSSGDFSSCGFDSHPGHHFPFSKSPAPRQDRFQRKKAIAAANNMNSSMRHPRLASVISSAVIGATVSLFFVVQRSSRNLSAAPADGPTYLGFDLNTYPGDQALPILRKTFSFAGYWLSPPPGEKQNSWVGKRAALRAQGFGFLVLYRGPQSKALKSLAQSAGNGTASARTAIASAKREGFPPHAIIFLDIEEGGRLPPNYHDYLRAWVEELARAGYRAGFYCSGMPVNEGQGVTIITADDIRDHLASRQIVYWVYNDACPPSPGCARPQRPPFPSASGVSYAAVWQFAQSPRRKEFTSRCAATYHTDGNCYAPGDAARAWFLDLNAATTPDPSAGGN